MGSRILVVDDDEGAREAICALLGGRGYRLETATNGPSAIEMAEAITPDLILLDVMMPGMDGFEVCRRLRANTRLREVPILLLTALDDRDSRLQGLQSGADDFLTKPIDGQELLARVGTITRLNRYRILLQQREDLQAMAVRVVQAQESERLRLSHEIHDDIGQSLMVHQIQLRLLLDSLTEDRSDLRAPIQDLFDGTSETFLKLRLLAENLRPPLLDTMGIVQALKACCDDFTRRTGLPVLFEADNEGLEVTDIIAVTLYRILQEALSNIARHAQANKAWVTLDYDGEELYFTVQDDGKGFPLGQEQRGLGLNNMQERVTMAGGIFHVHSIADQGTVITVRFPNNSRGPAEKAEAL
jgi:signal transduction histidine kinase